MIDADGSQAGANPRGGKPDADTRARSRELVTDLQGALEHHQAGRLREAETLYTKLLDAAPGHPGVSRLLGVVKTRTRTG